MLHAKRFHLRTLWCLQQKEKVLTLTTHIKSASNFRRRNVIQVVALFLVRKTLIQVNQTCCPFRTPRKASHWLQLNTRLTVAVWLQSLVKWVKPKDRKASNERIPQRRTLVIGHMHLVLPGSYRWPLLPILRNTSLITYAYFPRRRSTQSILHPRSIITRK